MALLGRHKTPCLSCGFEAPHVKQNEGKLPYIHCPDCGLIVQSKNGKQAAGLMAGMRQERGAVPEPPQTSQPIIVPTDTPAAPAPAAKPAPRSVFSTLLDLTNGKPNS